ncbi:hypothetical protein HYH03_005523 [Edaphochlamys debaryana]|uniref:Uncharacterized protein n=1 Tax=Edaphochlamys debaryana TaxID=47281 RepID=A0A835Y537_9CHLO|nr:hypothetical protein HYH03_005523 [Edaphochlamys debaryana]|eukprot:KAG2496290.1 hypothetical protein HYH03_005523 [Edaphochlamys debaryana]
MPLGPPDLADVLRELSVLAADVIVKVLMLEGSLAAARLASRALRDLVDASIPTLRISLNPATAPHFLASRPSLDTWPRINKIMLELHKHSKAGSLSSLLILPFMDQSPHVLQRINTLKVDVPQNVSTRHNSYPYRRDMGNETPAMPIMWLALLLPNLRELDLSGLRRSGRAILPSTPPQQRLMYDSLSKLASLDTLSLPACDSLAGIEALAGTLQHLTIGQHPALVPYPGMHDPGYVIYDYDACWLAPSDFSALSQLSSLRTLIMCGVDADWPASSEDEYDEGEEGVEQELVPPRGGLTALLNQLSPELCKLTWHGPCLGDEYDIHLDFVIQGGTIDAVGVNLSQFCLAFLAGLAEELILPSRAWGSTRPELKLDDVYAPLGEEDLKGLVALRQKFSIVAVDTLTLGGSCGAEDLQPVADLLRLATSLKFTRFSVFGDCLQLKSLAAEAAAGEQRQGPAARLLPASSHVLLQALEDLTPAGTGAGGVGLLGSGSKGKDVRVLLARGAAAEALSQLDPAALREWAMRVERRAEAAALAAGAGAAEGGGSGSLLSGVQALPPAAALVVECGWADGAADAVAVALGGEGLELSPVCADTPDEDWMPLGFARAPAPLAYTLLSLRSTTGRLH